MHTTPAQTPAQPRPWRQNVLVPGLLHGAVEQRITRLGHRSFSSYVVQLVCSDLRKRQPHQCTGPLAKESAAAQQAVDCEILRHARSSMKLTADQISEFVQRTLTDFDQTLTPVSATRPQAVFFPAVLQDVIEQRAGELRFATLSQYVTSVIRYDLLRGELHEMLADDDASPEVWAALDRETIAAFHARAAKPKKCHIDFAAENVLGRMVSLEQRHAMFRRASLKLRDEAVSAQRLVRQQG